jgi:hypothetical protein
VARRFFPLDDELGLLPGHLTPNLVQSMARLAAKMPFEQAVGDLAFFTHATVPEATLRRHVQAAGAAYVSVQETAVEELERTLPPAPAGPPVQQVSVDGALVPLVHGEWAEVRTVAVGVVEKPVMEKGEPVVHTGQISYFSRLCDAETFGRLATVETHRRGTENAGTVCAVVDGAEWEQGFIDLHCPKAVRILDFWHAGEHVAAAGRVVFGEGTEPLKVWLGQELHLLKHDRPEVVVQHLQSLKDERPDGHQMGEAAIHIIDGQIGYLEKRYEQMRYAQFITAGYPIGSGMVESGNKLVVEARLKGAGMHWARRQVNPMLALRNVTCSDRWEEAWPQICQQLRHGARERRQQRRCTRATLAAALTNGSAPAVPAPKPPHRDTPASQESAAPMAIPAPTSSPHRPAADHPWRRSFLRRLPSRSPEQGVPPKE